MLPLLFTRTSLATEARHGFLTHTFFSKYLPQIIGFLLIVIVVAIWAFTYSRIVDDNKTAIEANILQNKNISVIVALNLEQVLNKAGLYAKLSRSHVFENQGDAFASNPIAIGDASYLRFAVFSNTGVLLHSSAARSHEPELMPLLKQALRAPVDPATPMFVGLSGKESAAWRLPLVVPITGDKNERIGFFAAIVDLGYFLQRYKHVDLGKDGSIGIFNQNGTPIAELNGGR